MSRLLQSLPVGFPTPIVVAFHLPPASRYVSVLTQILQRSTVLHVKWAEDKECLLSGTVYIAPQDCCTVLHAVTGCLLVSSPEALTRNTPNADNLFGSAAVMFGSRTLAVVLSGVLSDGAAGSALIAEAGGRVLVQSASDAQFPDMPNNAMKRSHVGAGLDSSSLARVVGNLVMIPGVAARFAIGDLRRREISLKVN